MSRQKGNRRPPRLPQTAQPGIDGSYDGSCIGCMRGTDTGLVVRGEAEHGMATLLALGVEEGVALEIVREQLKELLIRGTEELLESGDLDEDDHAHASERLELLRTRGFDPGMVPPGDFDMPFQVCSDCADPLGLPVALISGDAGLPVIEPGER